MRGVDSPTFSTVAAIRSGTWGSDSLPRVATEMVRRARSTVTASSEGSRARASATDRARQCGVSTFFPGSEESFMTTDAGTSVRAAPVTRHNSFVPPLTLKGREGGRQGFREALCAGRCIPNLLVGMQSPGSSSLSPSDGQRVGVRGSLVGRTNLLTQALSSIGWRRGRERPRLPDASILLALAKKIHRGLSSSVDVNLRVSEALTSARGRRCYRRRCSPSPNCPPRHRPGSRPRAVSGYRRLRGCPRPATN